MIVVNRDETPRICGIIQGLVRKQACDEMIDNTSRRLSRDWSCPGGTGRHGCLRMFVDFWNVARCRPIHNAVEKGESVRERVNGGQDDPEA